MPVGRLNELITRLGQVDPAAVRRHAGVLFDARRGMGEQPDAANIDYRGFQAYMYPSQFLGLNAPRDLDLLPIDHIRDAVKSGQAVGPPMLYVDKSPKGWQVRGHEGRGRMHVLKELDPAALYPVGIHPYGEIRARDLTPEDIFNRLLPDRGGELGTRPPLVIWQQRPYVRPGDESNWAVHTALRELSP